jgi:hypothetical protein
MNLPMIGASYFVSYLDNEGCHGVKIGFVFGLILFGKYGLSV